MYEVLDFTVVAEINGVEVPAVSVVLSYELNRIPQGTLVMAPGVNMATLKPSAAHEVAGRLQFQAPAKIRLVSKLRHRDGEGIAPEGERVIFDGYAAWDGFRRGTTVYALAIQLVGWPADLSFSSTLGESVHPTSPVDFAFRASISEASPAAGGVRHFVPATRAQTMIRQAGVQADLWGRAIRPWFLSLADVDRLNLPELPALNARGQGRPTGVVRAALERFKGTELALDLAGADAAEVARAIAEEISLVTDAPEPRHGLPGMAHTTFWNKLVGDLAPTFLFSVVPCPEYGLVVPLVPGLREHWRPVDGDEYTIRARDYEAADTGSASLRPLRGVIVYCGSAVARMGGFGEAPKPQERTKVIGAYVPGDAGVILPRRAPRYLERVVDPRIWSADALAVFGAGKNAVDADLGAAPAGPTPDELAGSRAPLLARYAQALYANEILKDRQGQIHGIVRLDVAPGSNALIERPPALVAGDAQSLDRFATVVRTTLAFDAEARRCGASFHLAHLRSRDENADPRTSVERHPLYTTSWPGGRLDEPPAAAAP
jgi:hypothetical protein